MRNFKLFIFFGVSLILLNSCANFNSNILFKIPKNADFEYDSIPLEPEQDFRLAPGDRFSFLFGTNNGEKIILNQSGITSEEIQSQSINRMRAQNNQITYLVRQDGRANLPLLGNIDVSGKTILVLENEIKMPLSENYIAPFVQIRVTNQRVIILKGQFIKLHSRIIHMIVSLLIIFCISGNINLIIY